MLDWSYLGNTLLVASISAVTFIAYKHPEGYRRIYFGIMVLAALIFFSALSFDLGLRTAYEAVSEAKPFDGRASILEAITTNIIVGPWGLIVFFGVTTYLWLLVLLPDILGHKHKQEGKDDNERS